MLKIEQAQEGLRERNKREKIDRIVRAGRALFKKQGYSATTTRQIAKRASVGVGTVFVYFPEKIDLLCHIFHEDINAVRVEAVASVPEHAPLVDQLMHAFTPFYDYYAEDPDLARVFVKELLFLDRENRERMSDMTVGFLGEVSSVIEAAKGRGEVAEDVAAFPAAYQLFGTYAFCLMSWLGGGLDTREVAVATLRHSLETLIRGIGAKNGEQI